MSPRRALVSLRPRKMRIMGEKSVARTGVPPSTIASIFYNDHTIITPTKCTLLLLKAPDIAICTLCLIFCPYIFQPAWVIFRGLNASAWLKLLLITVY
jgi:hypothetical protein